MKLVLDTNILISALGWNGNERNLILSAFEHKIELILSLDILTEFVLVLQRPKFEFIEKKEIMKFLEFLFSVCNIVTPKEKIELIKDDPEDNKILECAVAGEVDFIITGDKHLLNLKKFKGIKIVDAKELLKIQKIVEKK